MSNNPWIFVIVIFAVVFVIGMVKVIEDNYDRDEKIRQALENPLPPDPPKREPDKKPSCFECVRSNHYMYVNCKRAVKQTKLSINCTGGAMSRKCYNWEGDLDAGINNIPLRQFVAEDGRRFNPEEYEVLSMDVDAIGEHQSFSWKKR